MNTISKLESTEMQFLLYIYENYKKSKNNFFRIVNDRDIKLKVLLEKYQINYFEELSNKFSNIEKSINSVDINNLNYQILNIVSNTIDEFDEFTNQICEHKIKFDDYDDESPF